MTPAVLVLAEAERLLQERCSALAARIKAGDDTVWPDYNAAITTMRALIPPERQPLSTTAEMAERLNNSPRTVRKLGKAGKLEAVRLGKRGSGAIRWRTA